MASRYHWLFSGSDSIGAISNPVPTTLALPAGAVLKRFQVRNCNLQAVSTGSDWSYGRNWAWQHVVKFTAGANSGRTIYTSSRRIPMNFSTFFAAAVPVFTFWWNAGDNEMGVNQKCSYGRNLDPAASITYTPSLYMNGAPFTKSGTPQGESLYNFAVLYYL